MRLLPRSIAAALLFVSMAAPLRASPPPSARGDVNASGTVDGADVTYLAAYLLAGGPAPVRACLGDVNADLSVSAADAFRLIDFVFAGGVTPPPQPAEVCNGLDDNCDGQIDDGVLLTFYPDNDSDGYGTNSGAVQACSQPPGYVLAGGDCNDGDPAIHPNATELCNQIDDDCDGTTDETFNLQTDPNNCGSCGNICTNPHGGIYCVAGVCAPTCNNGWASCDSDPDNGCETLLDTNPSCGGETPIPLSGDTGAPVYSTAGRGEAFFVVRFTEDDNWVTALTGAITLQSPSDADYDLIVYCTGCAGSPARSSQAGTGQLDRVDVSKGDTWLVDDSFYAVIEVKFYGAATSMACGNWILSVYGHVTVTSPLTCP